MPNLTPEQKMVQYVEVTSAALEKAAAVDSRLEKQAAACNTLIPACVQALLDNGRIEPHQGKEAALALQNPVKALEILTKVASHRNDAEEAAEARIGTPTTETKTAGANSGSTLRDSDQRLFRNFGLPVPKE